ncbi:MULTISPECIES: vWA domain-containing protein [unclassified Streptomyces]|uniref:vWA domain-containing protein n=1 Tax=unclassified Streptomyces TaxID=2593676 RepID=UPI002E2C559D|nr:vWA domain-containing protein [Streptomyces sp. NBC_00223]
MPRRGADTATALRPHRTSLTATPGDARRAARVALSRLSRAAGAAAASVALALLPMAGTASAQGSDGLETLLNQLTARQSANYAVLIDTSGSMETSGYYARVLQVLPRFLSSLTPQDQVCLITFSTGADVCDLVSPSQAQQKVQALPRHATGGASDFGRGFESALDGLRRGGTATSGVLLLSDAELNAPDDPEYKTFGSPGWARLRQEAGSLPGSQSLTGYGVPFGKGGDVQDVLAKVLPHVQMLDPTTDDLSSVLDKARDDTRVRQAKKAVVADAGKGVAVSWPGTDPGTPLVAGSVLHLRLTATTVSLPVRLSGLRLNGLPDGVHLTQPLPDRADLPAGQHKDYALTVASVDGSRSGWTSGQESTTGKLSVDGVVSTPLAADVKTYLGGQSTQLADRPAGDPLAVTGTVRKSLDIVRWLVAVVGFVLVVGLAIAFWRRSHPSMTGMLVAEGVTGARVEIPLQGETETNRDLSALFERGSAKVRVRSAPGWPGSRPPLRLLCQVNGQPAREATCRPDDRVLLCGIDFQYHSGQR